MRKREQERKTDREKDRDRKLGRQPDKEALGFPYHQPSASWLALKLAASSTFFAGESSWDFALEVSFGLVPSFVLEAFDLEVTFDLGTSFVLEVTFDPDPSFVLVAFDLDLGAFSVAS